jgi:glycosyltransferase involved in cell wall biosynthesis
VLDCLRSQRSFLMVGTLEPRKGHEQVLEAFEQLWENGLNINLVIVGKQGWLMEAVIKRLRTHRNLNRQLFWLEDISDEYLKRLYDTCTCLIAASYGEGFGLPLIEAAQHKLPIIARDIPVFREVAGPFAYYFETKSPDALAQAIKAWLTLFGMDQHNKSSKMPWLTWKESAQQLSSVILSQKDYTKTTNTY